MRRAISLLSTAHQQHHHIHLNTDFRSDMAWWSNFAKFWNGVALIIPQGTLEHVVTSDASGSWGCGAWYNTEWFQIPWDDMTQSLQITVKEMIPIIVATCIWGHSWSWSRSRVIARCDNAAVVAVLNSRYSKDKLLMQMLRCLFFIEAIHNFKIQGLHIPGSLNDLADDLSRNNLSNFLSKMDRHEPHASKLPPSLLQWLLHPTRDWTLPHWMQQFS